MTVEEIKALAQVYRAGLPYVPPQGGQEITDFYACGLNDEFQQRTKRYRSLALGMTGDDGSASPGATADHRDAVLAAKLECEEVRDAMRALWNLRKVERLLRRSIQVTELRSVVDQNHDLLFPNVEVR